MIYRVKINWNWCQLLAVVVTWFLREIRWILADWIEIAHGFFGFEINDRVFVVQFLLVLPLLCWWKRIYFELVSDWTCFFPSVFTWDSTKRKPSTISEWQQAYEDVERENQCLKKEIELYQLYWMPKWVNDFFYCSNTFRERCQRLFVRKIYCYFCWR